MVISESGRSPLAPPQRFLDPPNFKPLTETLNQSFLEVNSASIYPLSGLGFFFNHLTQEKEFKRAAGVGWGRGNDQ